MPNYKGKRPGTRRIVIWQQGKPQEWVIRGTKADGDRFEARKRLELEANVHETRVAPNFSQLSTEKYSPYARANVAKSTWRARRSVLASLCAFFGRKTTVQITSADVEAYKAKRIAESSLNANSVNTELHCLHYVLSWAKKQGYPVVIPEIRYLKAVKGRVRVWSPSQISTLLAHAQERDRSVYRLIAFLANTGMRKGEGIACRWSWIDLDARLIRIPASHEWAPKSRKAREVPISDECLKVLKVPRRSDEYVFPNNRGAGYAFFPDAIFKELEKEAGIAGGPHTLRHSYASEFLKNNPDMFLLSRILGHTYQKTTELYSHLLPEYLLKGRDSVNIGLPDGQAPTPPEPTVGRPGETMVPAMAVGNVIPLFRR